MSIETQRKQGYSAVMTGIDHSKIQTVSLGLLALIGIGLLLHLTKSFMIPFVIAVLLSYLLIPLANLLEKVRVPSVLANIVVILIFWVGVLVLAVLVYGALNSVAESLPEYLQKYDAYLKQFLHYLQRQLEIELSDSYRDIKIEHLFTLVSPGSLMHTVNKSLGTFVAITSQITLLMIFMIFIIASRKVLINKIFAFFNAKEGESDETFLLITTISKQIKTYIVLKTLISIGTGFVFGMVAFLTGLDFAFIWGFLGFALNFIPTVGPVIASIPPVFLALLQFDSLSWAAFVSLSMAAVQFASGSFIEPLIMGDRLNLNIIAILMSLFMWGLIWGFPGMILAVPITAAVNIIFRNIAALQDFSLLLSK